MVSVDALNQTGCHFVARCRMYFLGVKYMDILVWHHMNIVFDLSHGLTTEGTYFLSAQSFIFAIFCEKVSLWSTFSFLLGLCHLQTNQCPTRCLLA